MLNLTYSHGGNLTISHVGKYTDTKNYTISMFLIAYSQGMKEAFREIKVNFIYNMAPVFLNPFRDITLKVEQVKKDAGTIVPSVFEYTSS
jgi:hypothetical protein